MQLMLLLKHNMKIGQEPIMKRIVRKAVLSCSRLRDAVFTSNQASPKEMLPVVDKPLIQYAC